MAETLKKLSSLFSRFPTVGPRTARRFVFYLTSLPKEKIDELIAALQELKTNVHLCQFCFQPFEESGTLCPICANPGRTRTIVCVIEKEADLLTIEATKLYKGIYFILGGVMNARTDAAQLRITQLKDRLQNPQKFGLPQQFTEVIIATNPTPEGRATGTLIERAVKELSLSPALKITRLANGLPIGGELEYADQETLESAFRGRT